MIIVSKTFTTLETLTTPARSRPGCSSNSRPSAIDGSDEQNAEAVAKHFVAVSTALES